MAIISERLRMKLKEPRFRQRYVFGCRILPAKITIEGSHPYKQMSRPELDCVHAYYSLRRLEQHGKLGESELAVLGELKDAGYAKLYGYYGLPPSSTPFDIRSFETIPSNHTTKGSLCCKSKKSTKSATPSTSPSIPSKPAGFKRKLLKKMIASKRQKSKDLKRERQQRKALKSTPSRALPEFHQFFGSSSSLDFAHSQASKRNSIVSTTSNSSSDSQSTSSICSAQHSIIDLDSDSKPLVTSQRSKPKKPSSYKRHVTVTAKRCPARSAGILPTLAELHVIATGGENCNGLTPTDLAPPPSPYYEQLALNEGMFLSQQDELRAEIERARRFHSLPYTGIRQNNTNVGRNRTVHHSTYSRDEILAIREANRRVSPREQTEEYYRYTHLAEIADIMTLADLTPAPAKDEVEDDQEVDLEDILQPAFMVSVAIGMGLVWCTWHGII